MTEYRSVRRTCAIVALGFFSLLVGQTAGAGTYTWGNVGTSWSTAADWGGTLPGSADVGRFNSSSYSKTPTLSSTASIGGLWDTGSGAPTILGSTLTISGTAINGNASTGIEMDSGAGALTIASALVLGGSQTWLDNSAGSLIIAGNINNNGKLLMIAGSGGQEIASVSVTGSGGLTQVGGLLTMTSGSNGNVNGLTVPVSTSTFSGNITVSGGTLLVGALGTNIGTNSVLGQCSSTRSITVNAGGTLAFLVPDVFGQFNGTNVPSIIINGGLVTNAAPPGVTFPVVNNPLNNVSLSSGTLFATTGESNSTGGYGSWDLNGSITSTGNSLISSSDPVYGNVMLSEAGKSGLSTTFNVQSGTLTVSAIVVDDVRNGGNSAGLNLTGSGLMLLTASNGYSGGTTVGGGTLQLSNTSALGSGGLTVNAGLVDLNGNSISVTSLSGSAGAITDRSAGGGTTTLTVNQFTATSFGGAINDGASSHVALALTGGGTLILSGTSNYTGGTNIGSNNVQLGSSFALGNGSLTLGGGFLDLNGNSLSVLSLGGSAGTVTDYSAGGGTTTLTVVQRGSSTFNGSIFDGGGQQLALAKTGTGQLILSGYNTYSGPTTINGGTLSAGAANSLSAASAHYVGSNGTAGTLDVTVAPQTLGALTVGSSGTLNISAQYQLTVYGTPTFAVGSTIDISGTSAITSLPYALMTYTNTPSGEFTNVVGLPAGEGLSYSTPGVLDVVRVPINGVWAANGTSATNYFTDPLNWTGGVPSQQGDTATVGTGGTLASIDLNGATPTISVLTFSNSAVSYLLMDSAGTGSLTLQGTGSSAASVIVSSGTQTISAAIVLASSADFDPASGTQLTLSGAISGMGALLQTDSGTLVLSGSNGYSGGTYVDVGRLIVNGSAAIPTGSSLTIGVSGGVTFPLSPSGSSIAMPLPQGDSIATRVAPVPEPSTLSLIAAALAIVFLSRRRRAASTSAL